MTDVGLPLIQYKAGDSTRDWGRQHGETYRDAIRELFQCRYDLLCRWVDNISPEHIEKLAFEQWQQTQKYSLDIYNELFGISEGAGLTVAETVILNNYTDFRDIHVGEQGCSTVYWRNQNVSVAGQTWDMHKSARNYLCVLAIPENVSAQVPAQYVMSVVGCVGLMGFNSDGGMIAVNNLTTNDARAGVLWPAIVRKTLIQSSVASMRNEIHTANITSGRNFLIANSHEAEMWEISPTEHDCVGNISKSDFIYHTNHCLSPMLAKIENSRKVSATTRHRLEILSHKVPNIQKPAEILELLKSHEGAPKSICIHAENMNGDPSETCGGAFANLTTGQVHFWRGCDRSSQPYVEHILEFAR